MNRQLVLTEEDLHLLVEDAVKIYLTEAELGEGWWGGVKNAWYGAKGGNFNLKTNYRVGNWASSFNKYAQEAQSAIGQMQTIATNSNNKPIATALGQIAKQMQKAAEGFNNMAKDVARPQQPNTTVKNPWAKKAAPKAPKATPTATATPTAGAATAPGTTAAPAAPAAAPKRGRRAAV